MITEKITTENEEIRQNIDAMCQAWRERDLEKIMALYAPDVVAFDAICAVQFKGVDAYRKHWEECLSLCPAQMNPETREVTISVSGDLAFAHYLTRCGAGAEENGSETGWLRVTACYRKIAGRWLTVHEHLSAPFDPATNQVLFNLQP
jgi:PhnB protein